MSTNFRSYRLAFPKRTRKLLLESLENRYCLAFTPSWDSTSKTLTLNGTAGVDTLTNLFAGAAIIQMVTNGATVSTTVPVAALPIHIRINGFAGNDLVDLDNSPTGGATFGGLVGLCLDSLVFYGGPGNDDLKSPVGVVALPGPPPSTYLVANIRFYGDSGVDTLIGANDPEYFYGDAGNDVATGAGGIDHLHGVLDNDELHGGPGNDIITGEEGFDSLYGDDGDDEVDGGDDNDLMVSGGPGNDVLSGKNGNDTMYGGDGADWIFGGSGQDFVNGDGGEDTISGGQGNDTLLGGGTIIFGFAEPVIVADDPGSDWITGDEGNDSIYGLGGDDLLEGNDDNDKIWAGAGADTIYTGTSGAIATFGLWFELVYGEDGLDGIDATAATGSTYLDGGDVRDGILGSEFADTIVGGAGDDILRGLGGADTIHGGAGDDQIEGNNGNDTINGDEGNDKIWGGGDNDTIDTGTSGAVASLTNANAPGGPWFEIAFGEAGQDGISARSASGSAFLDGGADDDGINGSDYGDTINGGGGEDFLSGYWGPDTMSGGADDDILFSNNLWAGPDQPYAFAGGVPGWPDMAGTGDAGCNYVDETEEGDCAGSSGGGGGGSGEGGAFMMAGGGSGGEDCGCGSGAATGGGSKVNRGERMARKLGELLLKHRVFELSTDGEWRVATPVVGSPRPVVTPQREVLLARLNASEWTPSAKENDAWGGTRARRTKPSEGEALFPLEVQ